MQKKLSKRRKRLLITIISGSIFILLLIIIFWAKQSSKKEYVPGEKIEGLNADLSRDLPVNYPKVTFQDVSDEAGIHFIHYSGKRTTQLPEDMGSGVAWGDFNNDGWQDLFMVNFSGPLTSSEEELQNSPATSQLYRNNQDGTFTEISRQAGVDLKAWANAASWGDYNNDGWIDLFVSCYGHNYLYKNNGDDTFTEIGKKAGVGDIKDYWTGISWGDYNADGHLDLYVCGYVAYQTSGQRKITLQYNAEVPTSINPSSFKPIRNLLYRNNGNGTFSEVAEKAGVANENGRSLSVAWCDFDEDGFPDLYVANDVSDNALFLNNGDGTFDDISYTSFVADYRGAMGIGTGDWDNDSDFDMFVTHWIAQENALYNNLLAQLKIKDASGTNKVKFMDEADRYGLGQIALDFIGFGTFFFDYDNDTQLDLFITNGSTFQRRDAPGQLVPMHDQLLWNQGREDGFYDVSVVSGDYFETQLVGRGAAYADYDNDGDLDICIVNNLGKAILLKNEGGNNQNWFAVKLTNEKSNTSGLGARIRLVSGESIQVRQVGSQGSYLSQNSAVQHFGLGNNAHIDTLDVFWPGSNQQQWINLPGNQMVILKHEK